MEDIMRQTLHFFPIAMLSAVAVFGSAFAADLPKERAYDHTACWSGVSNAIAFSKTPTASSWEMTATTRSNPPGGVFDNHSFRCVGINYELDGKAGGTSVCESVDRDGDKRLTFFSTTGDKVVRENITGTGKYEGMIASGTVQPLGPFPVIDRKSTRLNSSH